MRTQLRNILSGLVLAMALSVSSQAAQVITNINTSTGTNTGTGDTLKIAFSKANTNFAFLDRRLATIETRVPTNAFYLLSAHTVTNATDSTFGYGAGLLLWDTNYLYVSVGTNAWMRAALTAW